MSAIRTRFAPSPTGYLHIGGARTALFAWLFAKSQNGDCLLRIEDTDKERSKDEYTAEIIESFKWLGVEFENEVIYQSNNADRYKEIIDQLLDQGSAYICKGEDLETDKKYRDQNLPRDNKTVVRFKMPEEGNTVYADIVKGQIEVANEQLDDFIIERSDGSATYNLCVVVDDLDSDISHVIRGDDHVNNTFKQINVFKALNKNVPTYGHVPMILGEDGKRLSKRHGALGVREYARLGILPEALKNYLLRLGWSMGDDEIFNGEDMKKNFQLGILNKSPATFSMDKLLWFNKYYLDQMSLDQLMKVVPPKDFDGSEYSKTVLETIRDRCSTLNEFSTNADYFFKDPEDYEQSLLLQHCKENTFDHLSLLKEQLEALQIWEQAHIKEVIDRVALDLEIGFGKIGLPLRLALTATVNSPSIDLVCEILEKEITIRRLESFLIKIKNLKTDQ
ncbi:glutamate--tRNA ligase [SAR86 cluster bacterium]|nr:glutamate--tRNA ligase [SAR86 cluster bacterium]